jgi:hypothetical protein
MSQFSVVVQVQRASKLANVTSFMLFLLSFYLSKLSTYTFDIELHIRTRHSSVSRPTLLTWSRPSLQHQGSKDYARNHKHTWNTLLHRSTRIRRWRGRRSSCRPGSRGRSRIRRHQRKVRTRQPCRITRMNDHTLVTKEVRAAGAVLKYNSSYETWNVVPVILPCLPARSPAWHVWGAMFSQGWYSPRSVGSRCPMVAVQFPSEETGRLWTW